MAPLSRYQTVNANWYLGMVLKRSLCSRYHNIAYLSAASKKSSVSDDCGAVRTTLNRFLKFPSASHRSTLSAWEATTSYRTYASSSKDEQRAKLMSQIDDLLSNPSEASTWKDTSAQINDLIKQTYGEDDEGHSIPSLDDQDEDMNHPKAIVKKVATLEDMMREEEISSVMITPLKDQKSEKLQGQSSSPSNDEDMNGLKAIINKKLSETYSAHDKAVGIVDALEQMAEKGKGSAAKEMIGMMIHKEELGSEVWQHIHQILPLRTFVALKEHQFEGISLLKEVLTILQPKQMVEGGRKPWWTTKRLVSLAKIILAKMADASPHDDNIVVLNTIAQTLDDEDYDRLVDASKVVASDVSETTIATAQRGKGKLGRLRLKMRKLRLGFREKARSVSKTRAFKTTSALAAALVTSSAVNHLITMYPWGGGV